MNDLIHPRVLPRTICRILGRAALFILGAIALSACQLPAEPDAIESQSIHIRGSGALMPLAQLTAETLMQNQPGSLVTVSGGGSGRGILSLIDGNLRHRPGLLDDDSGTGSAGSCPRRYLVESAIIAYDAIVPFVHPDNPSRTWNSNSCAKSMPDHWSTGQMQVVPIWRLALSPAMPVQAPMRHGSSLYLDPGRSCHPRPCCWNPSP